MAPEDSPQRSACTLNGQDETDESAVNLSILHLMSLADSALPVGGLAHSWGMEESIHSGRVSELELSSYLNSWCDEVLRFECNFVAAAHRLGNKQDDDFLDWQRLNQELSAFKSNREGRVASLRMGRRLSQLMTSVRRVRPFSAEQTPLDDRDKIVKWWPQSGHYAPMFGIAAQRLGVTEASALLGFANQSVTGLVSAAQRLLPLGQIAAAQLIWKFKPLVLGVVHDVTSSDLDQANSFAPLLDISGMRHPYIPMRLFLT
jgi:urease accessory protein